MGEGSYRVQCQFSVGTPMAAHGHVVTTWKGLAIKCVAISRFTPCPKTIFWPPQKHPIPCPTEDSRIINPTPFAIHWDTNIMLLKLACKCFRSELWPLGLYWISQDGEAGWQLRINTVSEFKTGLQANHSCFYLHVFYVDEIHKEFDPGRFSLSGNIFIAFASVLNECNLTCFGKKTHQQ